MSQTTCKIIVFGNLVTDAEFKQFNNSNLTSLRVAVDFFRKGQDNNYIKETEFYNVDYWGNLADFLKAGLLKGKKVFVTGALRTKEYTDKDGQKKVATFIRADEVIPAEVPSNGAQANGQPNSGVPGPQQFNGYPQNGQPNGGQQGYYNQQYAPPQAGNSGAPQYPPQAPVAPGVPYPNFPPQPGADFQPPVNKLW